MNNLAQIILLCGLLILGSCGDSGGSGGDGDNGSDSQGGDRFGAGEMAVDWSLVPEKFNPEIYEEDFSTEGLSYIDLSIFDISNKVKVTLSTNLISAGKLKIYRVRTTSSVFGRIKITASSDKLKVRNYSIGQAYSCLSMISNGKLTDVDGACNMYAEVILPADSKIEVYSGEQLVSKLYFPMDIDRLMTKLESGFNADKLEEVSSFLASYKETKMTPVLTSLELEEILENFSQADKDKYSALKQLHIYISDRQNLSSVIDKTFTFASEQEKARRIVGL